MKPTTMLAIAAALCGCTSPLQRGATPPSPNPAAEARNAETAVVPNAPGSSTSGPARPAAALQLPTGVGTLPKPYREGASQFLVQPGQFWQHLVEDIGPGDEVVLASGFHAPQVIEGLQGTAEKPIFVRSRDGVPAAVAGGDSGLVFRNCSNLVIENLLFINAVEAGLTIESTDSGTAGGMLVRQCEFRGSRGGPGQDAVRLRGSRDVRLVGLRVDGWQDAAVKIDRCQKVHVHTLMTTGAGGASARRTAIAVTGASRDVLITNCAWSGNPQVGVDIGAAGAPGAKNDDAVPTNVRIEQCIFNAPGRALLVRGGTGVLLSRCTILDPRECVYSIPGDAQADRIRIERCLTAWMPGGMRTLSFHGNGVMAEQVSLGENIWWSKELPEAWDAIGRPFGVHRGEQLSGIDPDLDPTTYKPRNPAAAGFGAN